LGCSDPVGRGLPMAWRGQPDQRTFGKPSEVAALSGPAMFRSVSGCCRLRRLPLTQRPGPAPGRRRRAPSELLEEEPRWAASFRRAPALAAGPGQAGWGRPAGRPGSCHCRWAHHGALALQQQLGAAACEAWAIRPPTVPTGQLQAAGWLLRRDFPSGSLERFAGPWATTPAKARHELPCCRRNWQDHGRKPAHGS